jgi:hypothetical protein
MAHSILVYTITPSCRVDTPCGTRSSEIYPDKYTAQTEGQLSTHASDELRECKDAVVAMLSGTGRSVPDAQEGLAQLQEHVSPP